MPLARTALYAQGENLHLAIWTCNVSNTIDLTRHITLQNRTFVISVSGFVMAENIKGNVPYYELIKKNAPEIIAIVALV